MGTALAYIRRSSSEESPVSEELQRDTIAALAQQHGYTVAQVYRDWGRSGGDEQRAQYLAMLDRASAGGVDAVLAYDQDRLARSNYLFAGLLRLADLHGFAVVTPAGNLAHDRNRDFAEMRGVMDGAELRKMRRRNRAIAEKRRARGDDRGAHRYGYATAPRDSSADPVRHVLVHPERVEHVLMTHLRTGSYLAAARALNAEHYPSQRGATWHATTVKGVVLANRPDLAANVRQGTKRIPAETLLGGVMRCHCGGSMSPGLSNANKNPTRTYYCGRAARGLHGGQKNIAESRLLALVKAEAAHQRTPFDGVEQPAPGSDYDDRKERQAAEALRGKVADHVVAAVLADLDAARAAAVGHAEVVADMPPAIEWDAWAVPDINRALRTLFTVHLGTDLLPARYEWRIPEWRQA